MANRITSASRSFATGAAGPEAIDGRARRRLAVVAPAIAAAIAFCCIPASAQDSAASSPPGLPTRTELVDQLTNQPVGDDTLRAFNLPESFLGRVADRLQCASFEERFRIVVRDDIPEKPLKGSDAPPQIAVPPAASIPPPPPARWPFVVGAGAIITLVLAAAWVLRGEDGSA